MTWLRLLPWAGWPLAALTLLLYLDKRGELAAEIQRCNADKLASIAEAERVTRETLERAHAEEMMTVRKREEAQARARELVDAALRDAASRPPRTERIVERVRDEDACVDTRVHGDLLDRLRE